VSSIHAAVMNLSDESKLEPDCVCGDRLGGSTTKWLGTLGNARDVQSGYGPTLAGRRLMLDIV
jgi:hypothetical protein